MVDLNSGNSLLLYKRTIKSQSIFFLSYWKLQALEVDPYFDHLQNDKFHYLKPKGLI